MNVNIVLVQFSSSFIVKENLIKMENIIRGVKVKSIIVMPEGCLSGYSETLEHLDGTLLMK